LIVLPRFEQEARMAAIIEEEKEGWEKIKRRELISKMR
jgi:hypothetical protein